MMGRSLILDTTVRFVFDAAVVLSVYLLFSGHNQPGGGFVGGLVAASAIALRYIASESDDVRFILGIRPATVLSMGLTLAAATSIAPLLFGLGPLDHQSVEWSVQVLGAVHLSTATVFDTGVYLIVIGLLLRIVEALGDDPDDVTDPVTGGPDEGRS